MRNIFKFSMLSLLLFFEACSPQDYSVQAENLTVAKAQKEIRIGMTSADVAEALGSPNIITTDDQRRESWVYDRISTDVRSSSSQHGVWVLLYGYQNGKSSSSTTQRTLTIIVKFDSQNRVRDFAYRASSF